MKIAVIQYNAGNIQSVSFALQRLGIEPLVTDDKEKIAAADKVIFPGVGEAQSAMQYLQERQLDLFIKNLQQPVLGICLGMQLMCRYSAENDTTCLGIFEETVQAFEPSPLDQKDRIKTPQMGWNQITQLSGPLFNKVSDGSYCYFVHGYYAHLGAHTIATTHYGLSYSSALHKDNFYGVQFHPEKSADTGQTILQNFLDLPL